MSIDLVVVNYRTPDDLEACLASIEAHPPDVASTLTIVEVDADENYTHDFEWGAGDPGRTIGVTGNIGYGRACNLGAAQGSNEIIVLLNADVTMKAGALTACHQAMIDYDDWGALGPRQVDSQNRIRHAGIFGTHAKPVHRGWNELDTGQYGDIAEAVTVSGSAYFVRRQAWNQLTACTKFRDIAPDAQGAFLPTPHYYEETWCSYHLFAHGWRVMYYGRTVITHKWHQASPVGGWADSQFPVSQAMFRAACDHHRIPHD